MSHKIKLKVFSIVSIGLFLISLTLSTNDLYADSLCHGHFVNPITDICWECLFPITIGSTPVVPSDLPDTSNPSSPIGVCGSPPRIGINIGYWEPVALTDVTPDPYCLVNMGGVKLNIGGSGNGGKQARTPSDSGAFYYVHWYKYPLIYWLQIITSLACFQSDQFDIAYMTELDPTWNDDELATILNPEAILFGNPVAQLACAPEAARSVVNSLPMDSLFWCAGTQGSLYPLTGTVADEKSPLESAVKLSERMDFKMHRELLLQDSIGKDQAVCYTYPSSIMPKSRYRYQLVNTIPEADHCYPFGHMVATWEMGHNDLTGGNESGFLIFKKRNCTFL